MSDLLAIGRSGIVAYRGALAAVGENVTNSDVAGFARRSVTLKEQVVGGAAPLYKATTLFGGVQATDVTRVWDQYKAADAWSAGSDANRSATASQYAGTVEGMLDDGDTGTGTRLTQVFTSAAALAANPSDAALRRTMLSAVGEAASALNRTATNLAKAADTARTQATVLTEQTNAALAGLAKVNLALRGTGANTAARAQLEDRRDALVTTVADAVGVDVTLDASGAATLRMNDTHGPVLVRSDDGQANFLALATAADGRLTTSVVGIDGVASAASPTSGTLAGLAEGAGMIAGRRQQLDGLATRFAADLDGWQAGGTTAAGAAGAPLLAGGDAASLTMATDDPDAIAAAGGGTANGNLLALSALRGPSGVEAGWRAMVTDQALKVSAAKTEATATATARDGALSALDETSGVDLDAQAAELLRFQQAYTASAKVIQTARDTVQTILQLF